MKAVHGEIRRASLLARCCVGSVAAAIFVAAGVRWVQDALAVPALDQGILREAATVEMVHVVQKSEPRDRLIEHTADESEEKIVAKPEPPKVEPVQEPEPEPEIIPEPEPEPEVKPEPKPEPVPEPKPQPKPKPKKVVKKPQPKPAKPQPKEAVPDEQASVATPAAGGTQGAGRGSAPVPAGGAAGNADHDDRSLLAAIVSTIEANKRYPRRARQTGVQGRVVLSVAINAQGTVTGVTVKVPHGSVLLNRAALKAAQPLVGMKLKVSRALTVDVPVEFTLK